MLSDYLVGHWYQAKTSWLALLLTPLECLYRVLLKQKTQKDLLRQDDIASVDVPVVVVGNITVGGVGKTPVVLALAEFLKEQGYQPGIVSRGYKAQGQQFPFNVTAKSDPKLAGDEPVLLASLSGCPVVVDPDRPNAVKTLLDQHDINIVLADDGLQHYALARDIEILVIDGDRGLGNQHCLPAGPLREPVNRIEKADFILINGGAFDIENGQRFSLVPGELKRLGSAGNDFEQSSKSDIGDTGKSATDTCDMQQRVHAVAGIGNPERFFSTLEQLGYHFTEHRFPDHHQFQQGDFNFVDDLPVVMTEKDAVKCQAIDLKNGYYLPVKAKLPQEFLASFEQYLSAIKPVTPQEPSNG